MLGSVTSDLFQERPGTAEPIVYTRSSRLRSGLSFFGALGVPLVAAAMGTAAGYALAGVAAGLGLCLLFFRTMVWEAFVRLWTFETLEVFRSARGAVWTVRRPFRRSEVRFPFEKILRLLEVCDGTPGRSDVRSHLRLAVQGGPDIDLGAGPSPDAQALSARLAGITGAPQEVERAPALASYGSGNGAGSGPDPSGGTSGH